VSVIVESLVFLVLLRKTNDLRALDRSEWHWGGTFSEVRQASMSLIRKAELKARPQEDERMRRLMTVPGVGPDETIGRQAL
jgi:hypothetical protein